MKAASPIHAPRVQGARGRRNQPTGRISAADEKSSRGRETEGFHTVWMVRGFLLVQIALFVVLASIHFGLLIDGYHHRNAGATEVIIVAVLAAGLLFTWMPRWGRRAATMAQSFATVGVLLGLFTIAIGIGPRTILDLTLNGALLLMLIAGLVSTTRGAGHVRL